MRLLYITNGISGVGGLERVLSVKASYFAEVMNYEVHILTLNDNNISCPYYSYSGKICFHNVKAVGNGLNYICSYIKGINHIVKQINPEIVSVCDDGIKGLYVPVWIKKGKAPIIYERHASMRLNAKAWQRVLMRLGGRFYNRVVVLTSYNMNEWNNRNLQVIPNPLPFYPEIVSELKNKRIICVGSLSYNKGYDLLITAWKKIAHECPDWSISIFGSGDRVKLQGLIDKNNLSGSVKLCGVSNEIQLEYLNSAFLVLPSRTEGFGMVLIEAMACGLPCVAFDCPCGPRDIIENEKNGFLVENGNIELLSIRMKQLILSVELRIKLGRYARQNSLKYRIQNIAKEWDNLFNNLLGRV